MMTSRRFHYSFSPWKAAPTSRRTIELTTSEIAQAALREISQLSLSALPFDSFLNSLLVPSDAWFRWISPLGRVRETKTAFSGLFGRFVARAYLTRYHRYRYFDPITNDLQAVSGWPGYRLKRVKKGDLPDWLITTSRSIGIAEAKGSYNKSGPSQPLEAARTQAARVQVILGARSIRTKRYAIATRWAVDGSAQLSSPWLVVHDPENGEDSPTEKEANDISRSIGLGHFASMTSGFGLADTAAALAKAKTLKPMSLHLPPEDLITVHEPKVPPESAVGVVVVPNGFVSIPREGDLNEFKAAVQAVFPGKCLLLFVRSGELIRLDKGDLPANVSEEADGKMKGETAAEPSFWNEASRYEDQSETIPLEAIKLSRHVSPQEKG